MNISVLIISIILVLWSIWCGWCVIGWQTNGFKHLRKIEQWTLMFIAGMMIIIGFILAVIVVYSFLIGVIE